MAHVMAVITWLFVFNVGFAVGWCLRVLWCEMGIAVDARWDGMND